MRTKLLKKLTFGIAFFAASAMFAQQGPTKYTFTGTEQGWSKGYGPGVVAYNATGGLTADGEITLDRTDGAGSATNNNANIRRGQGGADAFIVLNADVYNFIKIRVKNLTEAVNVQVSGTFRPAGTTGAGVSFPNTTISNVIAPKEAGGYQTIYLDITALTGEITRLDLLFRASSALTDPAGAKLFIDEIEFLTTIPPTEYSEFVQNPNFEDPTGVAFYTGNGASRSLSFTAPKEGSASMKNEFTEDQTSNFWSFSNYKKTYAANSLVNKTATVKLWVKTNRTTPAEIIVRLKTTDASGSNTSNFPTAIKSTTNFSGAWEELTFDLPFTDAGIEGVTMFFGVNYTDGAPTNAANGNIFYFDKMSATIATTLGVKENTLEGVSMYPNPTTDAVTINSINGGDITVFNSLGATVLSAKNVSTNHQLSISSLSSGVYFVKIVSDNKSSISKIVKK
ncbi:hypothetical protein FFWV33_02835 [Flavobacterium faecale]|uniref:Secretion system C-terminal sorting domain-containing protein n=1 Tax=Flavobacterium faecale TaxID=1355330 RepID=A0A2S1L9Y4_9FLAO|nr:T9SS type A sorting domain-containing protein [Flavobacterium faecale]AWG20541.1 hypothetical protein FFWV33_02835 [Flavobacterium faecale]